jgi:DNA-binding beta-propeller fold protein YncE
MRGKATILFVMFLVVALLVLVTFVRLSKAASNTSDYKLVTKITLGGEGGWDYFDVDPSTSHVFIPRGDHILVVDSRGRQLADVGKAHDTHAIAFAPELKSAYLSAEGSVDTLDLEKMQIIQRIDLSRKDPDAILYDASSKRVFTFNGGGTKDASVIDTGTGKVVGSIPLGGKPEFAQADGDGHIYVNVEDKSQLVAFDSKTLKVLHTWSLAPCKEPSGLAIDVEHKRIFAGCHNQMMAMVDYTNGKVVATVPIGKGVDANRFDPATGLAFASCGDGSILCNDNATSQPERSAFKRPRLMNTRRWGFERNRITHQLTRKGKRRGAALAVVLRFV